MITMQLETFGQQSHAELEPIFKQHWEEIALNKDLIPLDIDWDRYMRADAMGMLHILAVRDEGKLVGYYCGIIDTHFHYKSTLFCFTDVYFLLPEYRKGFTAIKMFKKVFQTLKERGITKFITSTKLHKDNARLFEFLGCDRIEEVWTKIL